MARHMRRCPPFAWISSRIVDTDWISDIERRVESWTKTEQRSVKVGGEGIKSEKTKGGSETGSCGE